MAQPKDLIRENSISEYLSDPLKPRWRDVPKSGTATFRLLNKGKDEDGHPLIPPTFGLGKMCTVYDKGKKRRVILKNVTDTSIGRNKDGEEVEKEVVTPVDFENGVFRWNEEDGINTFVFLMRHPRNADNPFRDKRKEPWFYIEEKNKELEQRINDGETRYIAEGIIRYEADEEELKQIAQGVEPSLLDLDVMQMKDTLLKRVSQIPDKIIHASNNEKYKMKVKVREAEEYGVIERDRNDRIWFWNDEKFEQICSVESGKDMLVGLEEFILEPGNASIKKKLEKKLKEVKEV